MPRTVQPQTVGARRHHGAQGGRALPRAKSHVRVALYWGQYSLRKKALLEKMPLSPMADFQQRSIKHVLVNLQGHLFAEWPHIATQDVPQSLEEATEAAHHVL